MVKTPVPPYVRIVRPDIGKGATATLLTRQLEPPLSPFTPPPNAIKVMPLQDVRED